MKNLPSTKQLQYLVALAQTQHFSKAAQICNVSQSTLSAGIKELETVLGIEIAERTKRSVIMTPIGLTIAESAENLIADAEKIVTLGAASKGPLTSYLRLGVIPTIAPYLLPKILPLLRTHYPKLKLGLRETQTEFLLDEIANGQIDTALLALPISDTRFFELSLFDDPFFLATPAAHPLARKNKIDAATLIDEQLLLLEEGHCFRDQAIQFCKTKNISPAIDTLGATSLTTVTQMVTAGFGLTLLPQMAIEKETADDRNIHILPFTQPQPSRTIGLVWRKNASRIADFQTLGKIIKQAAQQS